MPRAPMRTERGTKCRELEPTHVEFAGKFASRIESPGVAAPERRQAKPVIQPDRNVRGERFPPAVDVAGPDPAAVTLRAGVTGAVQTPRTDVGTVLQRSFIVTAMPRQARFQRQLVTVVRPPAIHAEAEDVAMPLPVIADVARGIEILGRSRPSRTHA